MNIKKLYELWNGIKPDISHLRISIIPQNKRKKFYILRKMFLFGYGNSVKGNRLVNPKTVVTSRDNVIMEKSKGSVDQFGK